MTNTTQTDITINELIPNKHYLFRVIAQNKYGIGESSPRLKVMTKAEINLPGQPFNVTAKGVTPTSIIISWCRPEHGSENLKEYKLFYMKVEHDKLINNELNKKHKSIFIIILHLPGFNF